MKFILLFLIVLISAPLEKAQYSYQKEDIKNDLKVAKNCVIDGLVYIDENGNGQRDPSEGGIGGVIVSLFAPGNDGMLGTFDDLLVDQSITNSGNGQYVLNTIDSGTYRVQVGFIPVNYYPIVGNYEFFDILVPDCPFFERINFGYYYDEPPLEVGIEYFEYFYFDNIYYIEWKTYFEENTVGFNLWAMNNGSISKINNSIIFSVGDPFGSIYHYFYEYEYCDCAFYLEEIDFFGNSFFYGPF